MWHIKNCVNLHEIVEKVKIVKKKSKFMSKHLSVYAGSEWTRYGQRSGQREYESGLMWRIKKLCELT